jgi:integrase
MSRRRFGAVRKLPSGRWQVRYRHPPTDRYRTAPGTFGTKTEAGRWLSMLEADMLRGDWLDPARGDMHFSEVAERWMATKVHLRDSTRALYDWLLTKHILPTFAERPIGSITTLDVQIWIADRHANSRLGPNSVAKAYKIVRAVMESAVDAGLILRSPCRVKGAATERLPEMRAATPEEIACLAQAAGPRWQALILLAAYSGLRWGELAGLRQKDVDALHRTVRVEHQLSEVNGRFSFSAPKTCAGVRTITLPQFIVDVVVNHLDRWSAPGPDGLVFVMPEGTPLRRENFRQRVWLPSCRAAGVNDLRFHDLRHTGATLAAASGAPLRAVMHRLGHASAAAAIRYQHRVAGQDEAIAKYLDGIGRAALPPPTAEVTRLSRRSPPPHS